MKNNPTFAKATYYLFHFSRLILAITILVIFIISLPLALSFFDSLLLKDFEKNVHENSNACFMLATLTTDTFIVIEFPKKENPILKSVRLQRQAELVEYLSYTELWDLRTKLISNTHECKFEALLICGDEMFKSRRCKLLQKNMPKRNK